MAGKSVFHPNSSGTTVPHLDIWALPPTQISVEDHDTTHYYPLAPVADGGPIEFNIKTPVDEYINFGEMYLMLTCQAKVEGSDAMTDAHWKTIKPNQYLLHSLFSKVDVMLGNKVITQSPQLYPYRSYMEGLLSFSNNTKKTYLTSAGWRETEINIDSKGIASFDTDGELARNEIITPKTKTDTVGREFQLKGRLHLDFTFTDRWLMGGMEMRIKLNKQDAPFYLTTTDSAVVLRKPSIVIKDAILIVNKPKVFPSVVKQQAAAININPAVYPITRTEIKFKTIASGGQDYFIDNIETAQLPRRMFAFLVPSSNFNGKYDKNSLEMKHFDLNYISAFIDGRQFPKEGFKPDFSNDNFTLLYDNLYEVLGQHYTDTHARITPAEFKSKYPIFAFQFNADKSAGPGAAGFVSPTEEGTLRLRLQFKNPLAENVNVMLFMEYDSYFEIHPTRMITTSYN